MLFINKLWHKNQTDVLTQPCLELDAPGEADLPEQPEPEADIAAESVDTVEPFAETADQISIFDDAENMPVEPAVPLCQPCQAEEESAADNCQTRRNAASKPPMCGEQLKMPSCAVNGDPVVNFASACAEENINAERPVFNLLSSRIDRDDRLAEHPGFKDVRTALARWQNAVHYFESVTNPDLIDFAIYELEAAKRQYVFLLQLAKDDLRQEGILASGGA